MDRQYAKHMFDALGVTVQVMVDSYGDYFFQNEPKFLMFKKGLNELDKTKLANTPEYSKYQELRNTFQTELNELDGLETTQDALHKTWAKQTEKLFKISEEMHQLTEINNNDKKNDIKKGT